MNRALLASILLLISFALVGTYAVGPPSAETPIAAVRLTANYTCSSDCDDSTNDHIQFGGVVFENNTSVVDCDIATGYTTTADVASKGRCVLYEPGTYEFTFYGGFDFSAATGVANVVVYDSTNSLSLGLLNILPWSSSSVTDYNHHTSLVWIRTYSSAEIDDGAWVEIRFVGGTASVTHQLLGSTFRIERLY
jgi:hypothetical protein